MAYPQDPQKRRGQDKSSRPHVTALADRSASGGLSLAPAALDQPRCEYCDGTGYAPNCTPDDRSRGGLWACLICCGTGISEGQP